MMGRCCCPKFRSYLSIRTLVAGEADSSYYAGVTDLDMANPIRRSQKVQDFRRNIAELQRIVGSLAMIAEATPEQQDRLMQFQRAAEPAQSIVAVQPPPTAAAEVVPEATQVQVAQQVVVAGNGSRI